MSHKSGHIIIEAIKPLAWVSQEQLKHLEEIEARDEYTAADRLYLAFVVGMIADDPAE